MMNIVAELLLLKNRYLYRHECGWRGRDKCPVPKILVVPTITFL